MLDDSDCMRAPLFWLPAGMLSWFAPGGVPVALVTPWMALLGGEEPRVRTAWYGNHDALSRFWAGGDFVLNVPGKALLAVARQQMNQGQLCFAADSFAESAWVTGLQATAPRLKDCEVQIECRNGILLYDGFEPELTGEVVQVHRHGAVLGCTDVPDLCAVEPLCWKPA